MESANQIRIMLFWLMTAVGAVLFFAMQPFSYVNDYIIAHKVMPPTTLGPGALWMFSIIYGSCIIPAMLSVLGAPVFNWTMLLLGGLLVFLNSAAGVFDGVRDGGHIAFLALLCIALPGISAIVASWRLIRTNDRT